MSSRMRPHSARWAAAAAIIGLGVVGAQSATGATQDEPTSTPVPISTPDGQISSYVVNAKVANPGQTRKVERAVEAAGGVVVQSWPQIGVVIAHSTKASFRTDVMDGARNSVESVGPTRSVAVSEGTPAGAQAPWGPGKGQLKKARTKQGDVSEGTAATSTDPKLSRAGSYRGIQERRRPPQDHPGVHGVQGAELHHQEEPPQQPRPHGAHEVLLAGPPTHPAPRDPLTERSASAPKRPPSTCSTAASSCRRRRS